MTKKSRELSVAEEVTRFLVPVTHVSEERGWIELHLAQQGGWKLESILLAKPALRKLAADPNAAIKIDYLRRDIIRSATARRQYRYPRVLREGLAASKYRMSA